MKTRQDKKMVKLDFFFISKLPFLGIFFNHDIHIWCMVIPLGLHLVRGPKAL